MRHIAFSGRQRGYIFAVNQDLAVAGLLEAGNQPQNGRFAATRWTEQRHQGAALTDRLTESTAVTAP